MTLPDGYYNPEIKIGFEKFSMYENTESIADIATTNFMQVVPMTHEEKVKIYMKKCKKKQLAEMLAACNEIIDALPPMSFYYKSGKWKTTQDKNGIFKTRKKIR